MNGVEVDADRRTVRAEGGVTIEEMGSFGLAVQQGVVSRRLPG